MEAILAIGATFFFEKGSTREGSQALAADEVVRVPLTIEGGDAFASDGLITVCAARAEKLLIASLTVWKSILLIEVVCSERRLAVAAHEVFGMVRSIESLYDFAKDRFAAMRAIATRGGSAIKSACRRTVDVAKHVVEIRAIEDASRGFESIARGGRSGCILLWLRLWLCHSHWLLGVTHRLLSITINWRHRCNRLPVIIGRLPVG